MRARIVVVLAALVALVAPTLPARAAEAPDPLVIAVGLDPSQGVGVVAVEGGFMKRHGLNAQYKNFEHGGFAQEAAVTNAAHIGCCQANMRIVTTATKGAKFYVPAMVCAAPKVTGLMVRPDITGPKGLEGKTVGMTHGSTSHYTAYRYMHVHGVKNVTIKHFGPPELVPAFARGDIQAYFAWEPWLGRGRDVVQGAKVLAYGHENNVAVDHMSITFSTKFVEQYPVAAEKALRALIEAAEFIKTNPDEAARMMQKGFRLPNLDETKRIMLEYQWGLQLNDDYLGTLKQVATWVKEQALVTGEDPSKAIERVIYPALLRKVAPERVKATSLR